MYKNYIDGKWVEGISAKANQNPSDLNDIIGDFAQANKAQALEAVAAARSAFPAWRTSSIQHRADALNFIGRELLARREELGHLLSREEGKTLPEGIAELSRAAQIFSFFAGEALRSGGEILPSVRPGIDVGIVREPVGVVGIVTPWNFPAAIPAWKIAPALAFGNCVVFKPAGLVPSSSWALAEIISRSGFPAGVFNLVMGSGQQVGQTLLESSDVDAISLTGSAETGARVMATAGARFAKLQLEMGGKNPLVILADADLDRAVEVAVQGSFFSTGQRCTASSRLIVERSIHDRFVTAVEKRLKSLTVGHALERGTDIGPVVDASQLEQDMRYVAIGQQEGAQLVTGGERLTLNTDGYFLSPALFANVTPEMRIAREEIFGPIACVIPADDYEHALNISNDTPFGLSAGICTESLKYANHFQHYAEAGMVMVNTPTAGVDYHVPFGGRKGSSFGSREQGSYAREFYTTVKTCYVAP